MTLRRAFAETEHKRRSARGRRRRQALIGLAAVAITTLAVVAVAMDKLLRPGAFPIKELRLEGEFDHLDPEVVQQAVLKGLGDNYFSLDLSRIEQAVEDLPWAQEARVRRSWPNELRVWVREQHPVARWGDDRWLNDKAQIIQPGEGFDAGSLVLLHGPDSRAPEVWRRYGEWVSRLADIGLEVDSIQVDDRFSWILTVKAEGSVQKIQILLGIDDHDRRIQRLVGSFPELKQRAGVLLTVDLRYPNGIAITQRNDQGNNKGNNQGNDMNKGELALNEVDQ